MARDLTLLRGPLAAGEEIDVDALDEIVALSDRREFERAADLTGKLLADGVFDVRPVVLYLYQAFLEGGYPALGEIFSLCGALLHDEAMGPRRRRADHVARRYAWLFQAVFDALTYHEQRRSPQWAGWQQGLTPEGVAAVIAAGEALLAKLDGEANKAAVDQAGRVLTWLRASAVPPPEPPRATEPPKEAAPAAAPAPPAQGGDLEPVRRRVELVVSHAFIELCAKLRAFEQLVGRGEMTRAAVVGDDILATLDGFDPRRYFPELIGPFSALLSEHIDALQVGERDTPAWKSLEQHYRVDLRGFVDHEGKKR